MFKPKGFIDNYVLCNDNNQSFKTSQSVESRLSSESSQTIKLSQSIESSERSRSPNNELHKQKTVEDAEDVEDENILTTVLSNNKCIYTNADQLQNKLDELNVQIVSLDADVIFVTEVL